MGIKYATYLCNFMKGERPCYAARIKNNGTVGQDEFLSRIAELSGETKERVRFVWDLAMNEIARCLKDGCREFQTPSSKTQSSSVYAFGLPAIVVTLANTQVADCSGDDRNTASVPTP